VVIFFERLEVTEDTDVLMLMLYIISTPYNIDMTYIIHLALLSTVTSKPMIVFGLNSGSSLAFPA